MRKLHQLLLISLVPFLSSGAVSAQGTGSPGAMTATPEVFYAEGMKNFRAANYSYAEHYLRMAAQARPSDGMIRYYLATCLVYLHRHQEAIAQYRKSYQLEPYGLVSGFCRRALLAYNEPVDGTTDARLIVRKPRAKSKEVDQEQLEKVITQGEMQMDAAVVNIRRQAEDEKSRKRTYAKDLAENAIKTGDNKAIKIKEEAEDQIRDIISGEYMRDRQGIVRGRGASYDRLSAIDAELVRQRTDSIRREAEAKAKLEKDIAAERSKNYQEWSEKRQSDLDKVADNLEKQLQLKPAQKSVSINPVGTGLYVRNYTPPREKGPDARPSVVRFVDKLDDPTTPAELGGEPIENGPGEDLDSKEVSEQVTGKVVDDKRIDKRVLEKIGDLDQSGTAGKSEKKAK